MTEDNARTMALTWLLTDGPLAKHAHRGIEIHPHAKDDLSSPWMTVDAMGKPPERYAIWRRTGAVHRVQEDGDEYPEAVEDDPIWSPPEEGMGTERRWTP
jgi:hypothetical protein